MTYSYLRINSKFTSFDKLKKNPFATFAYFSLYFVALIPPKFGAHLGHGFMVEYHPLYSLTSSHDCNLTLSSNSKTLFIINKVYFYVESHGMF